MDQSKNYKSWEKLLNPDKLKSNLILSGIYLVAFETLKYSSIVNHVKGLYLLNLPPTDEEKKRYKERVLRYSSKGEFYACCLWLLREGAIDKGDLSKIDSIRRHRNEIAHELPKFVSSIEFEINFKRIQDIYILTRKIDTWWIRNIDPPLDENLNEIPLKDVPGSEITSGNVLFLEFVLSINDNEKYLKTIYNEFQKRYGEMSK
jgi:hypothetical protein